MSYRSENFKIHKNGDNCGKHGFESHCLDGRGFDSHGEDGHCSDNIGNAAGNGNAKISAQDIFQEKIKFIENIAQRHKMPFKSNNLPTLDISEFRRPMFEADLNIMEDEEIFEGKQTDKINKKANNNGLEWNNMFNGFIYGGELEAKSGGGPHIGQEGRRPRSLGGGRNGRARRSG